MSRRQAESDFRELLQNEENGMGRAHAIATRQSLAQFLGPFRNGTNGTGIAATTTPAENGAQAQGPVMAIIYIFSALFVLLLAMVVTVLGRKLREKRESTGTYQPSNEEQALLSPALSGFWKLGN
ncbi:protein crumbs homolog 3-like isoform X2 [Sarcophilus harrisii]|uniref:protein crumbs homolog 3-like isoform X2 n=1 Tax=Sarcophilus harrisii TaxID=9305 RepID=UPI0013019D08|nr:protein crumbs homolog 3-like isoform X2 [Sarcophilus harrisii]